MDFSVLPSKVATPGVGAAVAETMPMVCDTGQPNETNAMFSHIEGDWDEVMTAVKR